MMKKNKWLILGIAVLIFAMVFTAPGERSLGDPAGKFYIISPATDLIVQVSCINSYSERTCYRLDGILHELAGSAIAVSASKSLFIVDHNFVANARKACYWADGSETGPPKGDLS